MFMDILIYLDLAKLNEHSTAPFKLTYSDRALIIICSCYQLRVLMATLVKSKTSDG